MNTLNQNNQRGRFRQMSMTELQNCQYHWDQEKTKLKYIYPLCTSYSEQHPIEDQMILTRGIPQDQLKTIGPFITAASPQSHIGPFLNAIDFNDKSSGQWFHKIIS